MWIMKYLDMKYVLAAMAVAVTVAHAQVVPPTNAGGDFLTCTGGSPFDRYYQFGDDAGENGIAGQPAGRNVQGNLLTFDSIGTSLAGDFNDLNVQGNPTYADTTSLPFDGGVGIQFDGTGDFLVGENLNWPEVSRSAIDYVNDDQNPVPGPCNYRGIVNRSLQFWAQPDPAGLGNGAAQSLVVDSNQHGVLISEQDTWVLRYNGTDVDSGVAVGTDWQHVMVARPFGPAGPSGGARLWIDGVAVAAASGDYASSRVDLVVGANTDNDENGNFTGGIDQFYSGTLDRLFFTVHGDSSGDDGPPQGQDYGAFDLATVNDWVSSQTTGVAGDLNGDGSLDATDRADFIAGWMSENLVNGLRSGDLATLSSGDLNFDGITDIADLVVFQSALSSAGLSPITPAELVPEPATWLGTWPLLGLIVLRLRRRMK